MRECILQRNLTKECSTAFMSCLRIHQRFHVGENPTNTMSAGTLLKQVSQYTMHQRILVVWTKSNSWRLIKSNVTLCRRIKSQNVLKFMKWWVSKEQGYLWNNLLIFSLYDLFIFYFLMRLLDYWLWTCGWKSVDDVMSSTQTFHELPLVSVMVPFVLVLM